MPELPEVETTVRGLRPVLVGKRIAHVAVNRPDLRRPLPHDLGQRLTGAVVQRVERRAKYGIIETDRGDALVFHLGMSGRWRIDPETDDRHDHVVLEMADGMRVALNDPRRFGSLDLMPALALDDWPVFAALGPEPLGPDLSGALLKARLAGKGSAIKLALLDQQVVAGLGNIYVCEALYRSGIAPGRTARSVGVKRLDRLADAIRAVLLEAIEAGGSTLRDYARPDGELGYFSKQFDVYGREGEACHGCKGQVKRRVQGGRSTFYCPDCQR